MKRWLFIAFAIFSVARPAAFFFGLDRIANTGMALFLASPLPLVFDHPLFFTRIQVTQIFNNGQRHKLGHIQYVTDKIRGPLGRADTYIHGIGMTIFQPHNPFVGTVLQAGWCGPIVRRTLLEMSYTSPVDTSKDFHYQREFPCP